MQAVYTQHTYTATGHTHGSIGEVEVEQVFILNLSHLDDGFIVQPLLVRLHLGSH